MADKNLVKDVINKGNMTVSKIAIEFTTDGLNIPKKTKLSNHENSALL